MHTEAAVTDRKTLDDMNSNDLDQLYADLDRARTEARHYAEAESADAAAGSYAHRAERVEAECERLRARLGSALACVRLLKIYANGLDHGHQDDIGPLVARRIRSILTGLDDAADPREPSTAQTFRERAEDAEAAIERVRSLVTGTAMTTAGSVTEYNIGRVDFARKVLAALDELSAPAATQATEQEKTTRVFAALHRSAEQEVTRVINLYEQWVKAGPPPLGVSMSRWWDARLVELRGAIHAPAEQPARTTLKNQPKGQQP